MYGVISEIYINQKILKYIYTQKELNLKQQRYFELIKDYDLDIQYYSGKVNIVADALSQKTMGKLNLLIMKQRCLHKEMKE